MGRAAVCCGVVGEAQSALPHRQAGLAYRPACTAHKRGRARRHPPITPKPGWAASQAASWTCQGQTNARQAAVGGKEACTQQTHSTPRLAPTYYIKKTLLPQGREEESASEDRVRTCVLCGWVRVDAGHARGPSGSRKGREGGVGAMAGLDTQTRV